MKKNECVNVWVGAGESRPRLNGKLIGILRVCVCVVGVLCACMSVTLCIVCAFGITWTKRVCVRERGGREGEQERVVKWMRAKAR